MKKFLLTLSLCIGVCSAVDAQQDLKKSVCVVRQSAVDSVNKAYERTATTLFTNSYMAAARQLRKKNVSFGSGFVYKSADGRLFVITNKHVVRSARTVSLTFNTDGGDKVIPDCRVIAKSDSTDIAVVEFPAAQDGV